MKSKVKFLNCEYGSFIKHTNLIKDIMSLLTRDAPLLATTDAPPPPCTFDVPSLRLWQIPPIESTTKTAQKFAISRKSLAPEQKCQKQDIIS